MNTDSKEKKLISSIKAICELANKYGLTIVTFAAGCILLFSPLPIGFSGGWKVFTAILLMLVGLFIKTWLYMRSHSSLNKKRSIHIITEKQHEDWLALITEITRKSDKV